MKKTIEILISILKWLYIIIMSSLSIIPLIWIVMSSFKTNNEIMNSAFSLPNQINFNGYASALKIAPIFKYYINSIIVSTFSTIVNVVLVSMAAYALVRFIFRGKKFLLIMLSSSLLVPTAAILMPIYIIFTKLYLYDTLIGLILIYAALGLPVSLFVMRSYFQNIPREIEEAAYVDGAGVIKTFFTIMMPIAKPGLATIAILQFLTSWNEFMFALILTKNQAVRTLPLALNYFKSQFTFNFTAMFAALTMVILPSIIIYFILQEQVTESIVAGSMKG